MSVHRRALLLGVLALAVAGVGVSQVSGAIPNPGDGRYYGCMVKATGVVKLINYPKVNGCSKGQKLISWNQQGPTGTQGAQGGQGPAGPADWNAIPNKPTGFADGVDNEGVTAVKLTHVIGPTTSVPANQPDTAIALCPAGSRVTGGGFDTNSNLTVVVTMSQPLGDLSGWQVGGRNQLAQPQGLTAIAVCQTIEPAGAFTVAKKARKKAR